MNRAAALRRPTRGFSVENCAATADFVAFEQRLVSFHEDANGLALRLVEACHVVVFAVLEPGLSPLLRGEKHGCRVLFPVGFSLGCDALDLLCELGVAQHCRMDFSNACFAQLHRHISRAASIRRDVRQTVSSLQALTVGLHRGAVQDQLLFVKPKGVEETLVLNQEYVSSFCQGRMLEKQLVRIDQGGRYSRHYHSIEKILSGAVMKPASCFHTGIDG